MKIKKLPAPWRITFDTNPDKCNLSCIMCDTHSIYNKNKEFKRKDMDFSIIEKVLSETADKGLKEIIPSTMGEPLLYKDFPKIIELAKKYNVKINLTTNGTFPILGIEKWAELLMPVVSDIKVSMNGVSKETAENIMVGIDIEQQIKNLKYLVYYRDKIRNRGINYPTITIQATFMRKNLQEIPKLFELAIKLNLDRFKGYHIWVVWEELKNQDIRKNKELIQEWNKIVDTLYYLKEKYSSNIKIENIYKIEDNPNKTLNKNTICPFLGKEAWIDWDGTFNICCSPDHLRRNFGYFGNVKENGFLALWNSEKYENFISNWGSNPICSVCNMRKPIEEVKYEQ